MLNVDAHDMLKGKVVLFFEILDFSLDLISSESDMLNHDNLLPLCWGYLRVNGEASLHLNTIKIQLYD